MELQGAESYQKTSNKLFSREEKNKRRKNNSKFLRSKSRKRKLVKLFYERKEYKQLTIFSHEWNMFARQTNYRRKLIKSFEYFSGGTGTSKNIDNTKHNLQWNPLFLQDLICLSTNWTCQFVTTKFWWGGGTLWIGMEGVLYPSVWNTNRIDASPKKLKISILKQLTSIHVCFVAILNWTLFFHVSFQKVTKYIFWWLEISLNPRTEFLDEHCDPFCLLVHVWVCSRIKLLKNGKYNCLHPKFFWQWFSWFHKKHVPTQPVTETLKGNKKRIRKSDNSFCRLCVWCFHFARTYVEIDRPWEGYAFPAMRFAVLSTCWAGVPRVLFWLWSICVFLLEAPG